MDVAIAGGHGQIALLLAQALTARGDRVRALIRDPAQAADVEAAGATAVVCDLERQPVSEVAARIADADAVVFAAGAGPGSGAARKWTVDFGGAAMLIAACKQAGVARYVQVSAMGADRPIEGGDMAEYLRAKAAADAALEASGLDWTVVRPGGLTDAPPAGRVLAGQRLDPGRIPRADVAAVLAGVLGTPATIGVGFDVVGGQVRIDEAVAKVGR